MMVRAFPIRVWSRTSNGFTLTELVAVVAILGVLAALIVPRVMGHHDTAKRAACYANQSGIEMQVKLFHRNTGAYPAADLSNISGNTVYFPSGLPVCPVDGSAYTIDTSSGLVTGHTH
jgi:prepilin-type N-terminal cleavage/methylation domain-containing protein